MAGDGITVLDEAGLNALSVSTAGKVALARLGEDQRLLPDHGLSPSLALIRTDLNTHCHDLHYAPVP